MNRFQLYELVVPILPLLSLDSSTSLCNAKLYEMHGRNCTACKLHNSSLKGYCCLHLDNIKAQQLKADIIVKHPELLI